MTGRTEVRRLFVLGLALAMPALGPAPATALDLPAGCTSGKLNAAEILSCVPPAWNGDLVVFAHGYVAPTDGAPVIPWDQLELPDGTSIPGIVTALGFAFATTSYSDDGLAILPAVQDVQELVGYFRGLHPETDHVYLTGASEGGLVTALGVEQAPDVFSGGLATCGPVGDFRRQIDYTGDFRALFDFFFPGLIPGDVVNPPDISQADWDTAYVPAITAAFLAHPARLDRLLRVSRAPFDPNEPQTKIETALGILWYNVFATSDAEAKLGGNPYDNSRRLYLGSGNDFWLNLLVDRYHADPGASRRSGRLSEEQQARRSSSPCTTAGRIALLARAALLAGRPSSIPGSAREPAGVRYGTAASRPRKPWSPSASSSSRSRAGSCWAPSAS
jgi:hypothetical protein